MHPVPIMMIIMTPFTPIIFRRNEEENTGKDSMRRSEISEAARENGKNAAAEDSAAKKAREESMPEENAAGLNKDVERWNHEKVRCCRCRGR